MVVIHRSCEDLKRWDVVITTILKWGYQETQRDNMTWELCDITESSSQIIWVQLFAIWTQFLIEQVLSRPHWPFCRAASSSSAGIPPRHFSTTPFIFLISINCLSDKPVSSHIHVCQVPAQLNRFFFFYSWVKNKTKVEIGCATKQVHTCFQCLHLYSIMADHYHALLLLLILLPWCCIHLKLF